MSDPRHARYNSTTGPSDNPDGGRYDNLTDDWVTGHYRIMSMDPDEYACFP